jgi:hypothetical protein
MTVEMIVGYLLNPTKESYDSLLLNEILLKEAMKEILKDPP